MKLLLQLLANGLVNGALYAMLAVGFGVVWRSLGVFHVAYAGLYVICSYAFYVLTTSAGLPLLAAMLAAVAVSAVLGWLTELGFYRLLHRRAMSAGSVLIASLGLFIVMRNTIALGFGNEYRAVPRSLARSITLGPVTLTELQIWQLGTGALVVSLLWLFVQRFRWFKALWAMGDQPALIPVLGLPLSRLRSLALIVSTALVGLAGSLITLDIGTSPQVGMRYLLIAVVSVLVGGIHSYGGWVFGAVLVAVMQSLVVWQISAKWMDLVTFALLVLILVFRPRGLLERQVRLEELS